MKHFMISLLLCSASLLLMGQPGTWEQKSSLGWDEIKQAIGRIGAASFSIGNIGYVATGYDGQVRKDCWAYDPIDDSWNQVADFGGQAREYAVAFGLNGKGYVGLGAFSDLWQYDPLTNSWIEKAAFPGGPRYAGASFCINSKGYVATGSLSTDLWQYDPVADSWTQKANFGGPARSYSFAFTVGQKGYIGGGIQNTRPATSGLQDCWEYDPALDQWTRKADFAGGKRSQAGTLVIGNRAFVGLGVTLNSIYDDWWEYDAANDQWIVRPSFTGGKRNAVATFTIGAQGYIVSGWDGIRGELDGNMTGVFKNDCYKYDAASNGWSRIADLGVAKRTLAAGFGIGDKGYIGMGSNGAELDDFWEYDTTANSWSQKAAMPAARLEGVSFSIGNKGYVGLGITAGVRPVDFWEFDPALNSWTPKANFPGAGRIGASGFSIGNKGYVGLGQSSANNLKDFWMYDPALNTWTQKTDFGGLAKMRAAGFPIGNKGYIVGGTNSTPLRDSTVWAYDPITDTWSEKAKFPAAARQGAVGFSIDSLGYFGTGYSYGTYLDDLWQYDTVTNSWSQAASFAGGVRSGAVGFNIGSKGYVGTGGNGYGFFTDFWQYSMQSELRTAVGDYSVTTACPSIAENGFTWKTDNTGALLFGINSNSSNLGATCWGTRIVNAGTYRNTLGWFGSSQQESGAYLPRNYLITPASQPGTAVTVRLYCTAQELADLISFFNTTSGTMYTESDLRIIRYTGINQDLDPTNNSNTSTDYTAITPTAIGSYGPGGMYRYLEFSTPGFSEFYIALSSSSGALPVTFLHFTATYDDGVATLQWQTAQEENARHFTIQRSIDGRNYTAIGSVPATGNSQSVRHYSYTDKEASALGATSLYYRIVETGLNNQLTYSKAAIVTIAAGNGLLSISPIPASDEIRIKLLSGTANGNALLTISDMLGRRIATRRISLRMGNNTVPVSISHLTPGKYFITLLSNGTYQKATFIRSTK